MAEQDEHDGELSQQLYVGADSDRLLDKPKDRKARCDEFASGSNSESSEHDNLDNMNIMQHFQKMMLDMQQNMFQAMVQQQKAALEYMRNELDEPLVDRHVNSPTSKYGDEREDNCLC